MPESEGLIPKHGGYRRLKSFQVAELVCDVTVRFCDRYIDRRSRRHTAHRGEITDGGSIPRFFWRVAGPPFQSPLLPAYIIHDHYCTRAADLKKDWPAEYHQLRLEGDELLREMAEVLGASRIKCWYLYRAVRIGATV